MSNPIRFSHLKAFGRSAAHGRLARKGTGDETSAAMERGTAVHALLFGTRTVIGYEEGKQRRGKDWEAFQARNPKAEILTAGDYERAARMAEAVCASKLAMSVLAGSQEKTRLFRYMNRDCRATPDACTSSYVTELKTCATSQPERFNWQGRKMAYHAQLAWYQDALELAGESRPSDAFIVAVEGPPAFNVTVMQLTPRALEEGRKMYRSWFEKLIGCEEANAFPGYAQSIVPFDVPEDEPELTFAGDDVEEEAA